MADWWRDLYEELYSLLPVSEDRERWVGREVDFIEEALGLMPGARVLDCGCGEGYHSLELARRGYGVTGLDISGQFIEGARVRAAAEDLAVNFEQGDMRLLDEIAGYDAVLFLDVAFGIFDDIGNQVVLDRAARALRAGGGLLLLGFNPYYWAMHPHVQHWRDVDGRDILRRYRFDADRGRLCDQITVLDTVRGERRELAEQSLRAYTVPELRWMCAVAGLGEVRAYGDVGGGGLRVSRPFRADRSFMLAVTARKPPT
ncbi:MAG: methyltransferase domain-containing protein [Ardenticatenaceae bacterium]|nr:methyltransferase domain-containing protein [Ardenticatenaceae bacterium]HBY97840.1 hypothetical protein [Chloroflexota bacterium]